MLASILHVCGNNFLNNCTYFQLYLSPRILEAPRNIKHNVRPKAISLKGISQLKRLFSFRCFFLFLRLSTSSSEFMLRLPSGISGPISEHMASFVVCLRIRATILAASHIDNIKVLAAPSGTRWVASREDDIFEMTALRAKYHNPIRVKHGNP
jgi:hypothetical protein